MTESTILNTLIGIYRIRVCNIGFRFNSSNDAETANLINIVYNLTVVFEPFGEVINIIKALIFRYIVSKKINFEEWNVLNSRDLEFNDSSVNIVT